jgi:hypothetical protein
MENERQSDNHIRDTCAIEKNKALNKILIEA